MKGRITKNATVMLEFSEVELGRPAREVASEFMQQTFPGWIFSLIAVRQRPMDRVYFVEFALSGVSK